MFRVHTWLPMRSEAPTGLVVLAAIQLQWVVCFLRFRGPLHPMPARTGLVLIALVRSRVLHASLALAQATMRSSSLFLDCAPWESSLGACS